MNNQPNEIAAVGATTVQAIAAAAGSQLITLDPVAYVAEVFRPYNDMFAILKAEADTITPDASTPAGMEICIKYRAAFRDDVRVAGEKARVERKAPILTIGKLLDSKYADLKNAVIPYEAKFDAAIKAEEKRKDDLKKAEAEREEKSRQRIVNIRELPLATVGKSAAAIAEMVAALEVDLPDESFGKLQDAAVTARADVLVKLAGLHAAAVASEEEAARIAAERAELAQLREAAAERQRLALAEAERVAAAQKAEADRLAALAAAQEAAALREREAAAAQLKAEADAQAEKNRLAQAEIDRQLAELAAARQADANRVAAEQARVAAEAQAAADRQATADQAERDRVAAEQQAAAVAEQGRLADLADAQAPAEEPALFSIDVNPLASGQLGRPLDEQLSRCDTAVECSKIKDAAKPSTPPTLRLGQISDRLGFTVTASFMESLGFAPAATDKAAKLYHEGDFKSMCAAICRHISAVQAKHAI